jgi:hypothetical protein
LWAAPATGACRDSTRRERERASAVLTMASKGGKVAWSDQAMRKNTGGGMSFDGAGSRCLLYGWVRREVTSRGRSTVAGGGKLISSIFYIESRRGGDDV